MPDNIQIPPALTPNVGPQPTQYVNPQEVSQALNEPVAPQSNPGAPNISEDPRAPESTQQLLDIRSGKIQPVPTSQVASLVTSGHYELPTDGQQYVVHKETGDLLQIPNTGYKNAISSGEFLPANDHDIRQEMYKQKYGDSGLEALATGAARGATLGLSDVALRGAGVSAGRLAGVEVANPGLSITGEVVGTVAGALAPVGPLAGAAKVGGMAENVAIRTAERAIEKAGINNPIAKSIVGKIVPGMVGGAVEGSVYGVGQLISEDMLGKADFNAENLAASVGAGALLGAGFGAGFSALKEAAPAVVNMAKDKLEKAGFSDVKKNAQELLGVSDSKWAKYTKHDKNLADDVVKVLKDENKVGLSITDDAETISKKIENFKQSSGEKIGAELENIKAGAEKAPEILPDAKELYKKLETKAYNAAKEMELAEGVAAPEKAADYAAAKKYEEQYTALRKATKEGQKIDIDQLQKMRQSLDEASKWDFQKNVDPVKIAIAKTMRQTMREEIDLLANRAGAVLGTDIEASLKAANRDYYVASKIADHAAAKAAKGSPGLGLKDILTGMIFEHVGGGAVASSVVAVKKAIQSDFRRKMVVLGHVEKANVAINKLIDSSAGKFFTAGVNAAGQSVKVREIKNLTEFELAKNAEGKKAKTQQEAFNNISSNIRSLAASPQRTLELTNKHTAGIHDVAPNTSGALDMIGANAINFLNSKLPTRNSEPGIMSRQYQPSGLEMSKFERYVNAVQNPKQVIEHFSEGKMSREEAETIKSVYPDIFSRLQDKAMSYIGANPNLPYQKKLQLGILLDTNTDPSLNPQNILKLQNNFQTQPEQPSQGGSSSQKGLQSIEKSNRLSLSNEED
jgi:hypothetical protein